MKRFFVMLAFLLPMVCVFTGCSDDDDPTKTELTAEDLELMQGTWNVTSVKGISLPGDIRVIVSKNRIELQMREQGGEYEEMESYTFKQEGVRLALTNVYSKELEAYATVKSLSAKKATLEVENFEYGTYTMHLSK